MRYTSVVLLSKAETATKSSGAISHGSRLRAYLLALMACSGCASLIYEIVWLQLFQLVIGSSAWSLGLLLAAYMGGLGLGSALLPKRLAGGNPLRFYAALELGTAVFGILALFGIPWIGEVFLASAGGGLAGVLLRGTIVGICLLLPTALMGGTLPVLARCLDSEDTGDSLRALWMGLLYSANVAGAAFGCLFAGFYLLRIYDMAVATYIAAAINLLAAGSSYLLASSNRSLQWKVPVAPQLILRTTGYRFIYLATCLSGLCALGAEVVWTRLLSLLLGATVYTFSIILAVFLGGLWLGSLVGSFFARRFSPLVGLAGCQFLLAASIAWTAYALGQSLPYWPIDPWLSLSPWANFQIDLMRCVWAIAPATLLWGASFPLAIAAAAKPGQDSAQLSGEVYAINTAGSIIGSLLFSLVWIPLWGTRSSEQVLIALCSVACVSALAPLFQTNKRLLTVATVGILLSLGLAYGVTDVPWEVIAYGRRIAPIAKGIDLFGQTNATKILFRGEGINSSILIAERAGQRQFFVSGKAEASTAPLDMRLERMMGQVPALIHSGPKSVLVVGFGAGITAGSFVPFPEVNRLVICELEPLVPPASTEYFGPQNFHVKNDSRTQIVSDDARHYIVSSPEKFDLITTDPIHPWVKGTSTLYSREYYELVKQHLNPGGVVAQWLPIYDSDAATVKSELATFFSVFPGGTIWSNLTNGDGFDLVLLGRAGDSPISLDGLQKRLDRADYDRVDAAMAEVGFHSAVEFLSTYAGSAKDLAPYLTGAEINTDMNLRLQYLAGLGLNSMSFRSIYYDILAYRKFPEDLIKGTGGRMDALRVLLAKPPR